MNEQLFNRFPKLWSIVNDILLKETLFDSAIDGDFNEHNDHIDVGEFIALDQKENFEMTYIQGAEEVTVDLVF